MKSNLGEILAAVFAFFTGVFASFVQNYLNGYKARNDVITQLDSTNQKLYKELLEMRKTISTLSESLERMSEENNDLKIEIKNLREEIHAIRIENENLKKIK